MGALFFVSIIVDGQMFVWRGYDCITIIFRLVIWVNDSIIDAESEAQLERMQTNNIEVSFQINWVGYKKEKSDATQALWVR